MGKLNIEKPRQCPFSKEKTISYDLIGPDYTPVPAITMETFNICIGDYCMMYTYDIDSDTESCLLARKLHEI